MLRAPENAKVRQFGVSQLLWAMLGFGGCMGKASIGPYERTAPRFFAARRAARGAELPCKASCRKRPGLERKRSQWRLMDP